MDSRGYLTVCFWAGRKTAAANSSTVAPVILLNIARTPLFAAMRPQVSRRGNPS